MFANIFTVLPSSLLNADLIIMSKVLMKMLNEPDPRQISVKPHSVILSFGLQVNQTQFLQSFFCLSSWLSFTAPFPMSLNLEEPQKDSIPYVA